MIIQKRWIDQLNLFKIDLNLSNQLSKIKQSIIFLKRDDIKKNVT